MKVGILGGTFDPVHFGHLRSAQEIGEEMGLNRVYLIPAAFPPHKASEPVAPFHHRLTMTRLGVKGSSMLEALDLEGRRSGASYSIETLRELHVLLKPRPELFFILGADAFLEIETWKDHEKLFDYAHFVVLKRPGHDLRNVEPYLSQLGLRPRKETETGVFVLPSGNRLILKAPTLMDISSSKIREMLAEGRSIRFLVPNAVLAYIREKGLYRKDGSSR